MYCILLFCLVAVATINPSTAGESRMAGGQITTVDRASFIVQLRDINGEFICGGTLVAPQYVITAAHCFNPDEPSTVTIVGGVNTIWEQGVKRKIIGYSQAPEYRYETLHRDVAVLKLDSPMTGPNIKPIDLCNKAMQPGDVIQVYGWGRTVVNGNRSERLRTYSAPVSSQTECKDMYAENIKHYPGIQLRVTDAMFCTYTPASNTCEYDSGGPVISGGKLCGIVSWGNGCQNPQYPTVFTSIFAVRAFINNAMRG